MSTFNSITAVLFCQLISVSCMLLMSRPHLLAHWDLHLKNIICMRWMQKQYSHQVAVTQTDSQGPVLKLSTAETPYWECCAPKRAAAEQTGFNLPAAGQSWFLHTLVPSWSSQFKGVSKRQLCHEVTGVTFECLFQSSHSCIFQPEPELLNLQLPEASRSELQLDGEDYSQKVWQSVTHYLKAEWAGGCQGTLSGAERDLLGTVSPRGHTCLCAKAMPWPKGEVIYINAFPHRCHKPVRRRH